MKESLEQIGLTKNEIKVYLTLLKLGSVSVGMITEASGVHRRNVYDAIERLIKRGLVGHVLKGKIKYFEAANPNCLLNILKEEKDILKNKVKGVNEILPKLLAIHNEGEKENE